MNEHLTEDRKNKSLRSANMSMGIEALTGQHEVSSKCCSFRFNSSTHNCYINHLQQDKNIYSSLFLFAPLTRQVIWSMMIVKTK